MITKLAAENLCELFHRDHGLPCLILRTSRFFPEADDRKDTRDAYEDDNAKVNEFLYRRADIEDVVTAHLRALDESPLDWIRPLHHQRDDAVHAATMSRNFTRTHQRSSGVTRPGTKTSTRRAAGRCFQSIDRVYVNARARTELGWQPRYDFAYALDLVANGHDFRSGLAHTIGSKGYHDVVFEDGPYPT